MNSEDKQQQAPTKSTKAADDIGKIVEWWYTSAWEAKQRDDMNVAWCMMNIPQEILFAMNIIPMFPEQYSTACAAKQAATTYCEKAETEGFSVDICSLCRIGLGYAAIYNELGELPPETPYGGIPKPDMFISRGSCDPGYKWFQALQYWNLPMFVYDDPAPPLEADPKDERTASRYINYYLGQYKELVAFLEKVTGRKMDWDRLSQILENGQEIWRLSYEINQLRKAIPAPMATQDHMAAVLPFWILTGAEKALDFARKLHKEVQDRVNNKIGVLPNEKYRLLWSGMATYHNMGIFNYFEKQGAVFAIETEYLPNIPVELDVSNPLEALAKREYYSGRRPRSIPGGSKLGDATMEYPLELFLEIIKDYHIDGVVMHSVRSCRLVSIGQLRTKQILEQRLKIPVISFEGDMADARVYSEAETEKMTNTFLEMLEASKTTKR
jgi:benzoyl-CoA reductase/2-hydroxyglutaryl-CoA dehydratase subunit BcrC/BadD/HgdB